MNINPNTPVTTIDGSPVMRDKDQPMLVRHCMIEVLILNEQGIDGEEKLSRYRLAQKVQKANGELTLTVAEAAKINELVKKNFGPLVVGQIHDLIESS